MTVGPPIPAIQFDLENSWSKVEVKGTPVSIGSSWLISFGFISIGPTIPKICQIECSTVEKTDLKFYDNLTKKVLDRIPSKFNHVQSMTRGIYLPRFVAIGWAVLTLSWGQSKFCPASVAQWPWPKVTKMGGKIFSHTHRLTMCGLKKLVQGFPESWKMLAERRQRQRKRTKNNKFPGYPGSPNLGMGMELHPIALSDLIAHSWPDFNGRFVKQQLKLSKMWYVKWIMLHAKYNNKWIILLMKK